MIRVVINGASGRLGSIARACLDEDSNFCVVGTLGRTNDLKANLEEMSPDVVFDASPADVAYENAETIISCGVRPVIGGSGISQNEYELLGRQCAEKALGGLIVPNFSVSAILMVHFSSIAANYFPSAGIVEQHHSSKLDTPSGTARETARVINDGEISEHLCGFSSGLVEKAQIHSLRNESKNAKQTVLFSSSYDRLSIDSDVSDPRAYGPGILLSCKYVMKLRQLESGISDCFGLQN